MKKELFELLVRNNREATSAPVDVSFGDLHELNQCVNAFATLKQEFSSNVKSGFSQDFWEGIALIQMYMEHALEERILECQKSMR